MIPKKIDGNLNNKDNRNSNDKVKNAAVTTIKNVSTAARTVISLMSVYTASKGKNVLTATALVIFQSNVQEEENKSKNKL